MSVPDGPPMSGYLDLLPAAMRDDFLGAFLAAFETVFTGLENTIEGLPAYLDPQSAPEEFLPWLAGWVALSLRADWPVETRRDFINEVVPLYRERGTPAGLRKLLEIYVRPINGGRTGDVAVFDDFDRPAHYFQVRLTLNEADPVRLRALQETARAIIDSEKPAHTFYALKIVTPTMRLVSEEFMAANPGTKPLILGHNTLLGTNDAPVAAGEPT
ncbi:phage tail protein I [Sphaerisporangium corydalis]|uniref:Phage tail protein I n=1 Tax=Sphaerisporangium corydalis TaxID=1441875 RepID=A0ABV9E8L0_9ACTN|nr:phage tail protein I [Sphaerisporangium corydalis]